MSEEQAESTATDGYVQAVLSVVKEIPEGKVMSYGDVAEIVGKGPRQVGQVMSRHGHDLPWWRVIYADGSPPGHHGSVARDMWRQEGVPVKDDKVDMPRARWRPGDPDVAGPTN